ncbi:MAG: YdiU family protein [Cytophagaceae bacterium]
MMLSFQFDNTYTKELPERLFTKQLAASFTKPELVLYNSSLAKELGLESPKDDNKDYFAQLFSGQIIPEGTQPFAQAYAGHQFGHFNILGDGRTLMLGEHLTPNQQRFDIQLKGSGPTPYSRRGDGMATLYSMLREYLISEAMYHLGIPTTRSLAVVKTGDTVYREVEHEGAVLTRVAQSHIRVGTFQYVRQFLSNEELSQFLDYVIQRHYPELTFSNNKAIDFLTSVMHRQIDLIVHWMRVGFIHGVMNTDNMSIPSETIDYGPCAFMNSYHPATVFSSIDQHGRYAYQNQPGIAHWNLGALAGALLPLIHEEETTAIALAKEVLNQFPSLYQQRWLHMMGSKIGLLQTTDDDISLIQELLTIMEQSQADYTETFYLLTYHPEKLSPVFQNWLQKRSQRISEYSPIVVETLMQENNPVVIPRNHLVEEALQKAAFENDLTPLNNLLQVLKNPYEDVAGLEYYKQSSTDDSYKTYCGT